MTQTRPSVHRSMPALLAPITIALALVVGACGSDTPSTTTTGAPDPTESPVATTAPTTDETAGSATDETAGRIETLFVSGTIEQCTGEGTFNCYPTRIGTPTGQETRIYEDEIEGFTHEEGHAYELTVRITDIEDPPADASSLRYELVEVVSDTIE